MSQAHSDMLDSEVSGDLVVSDGILDNAALTELANEKGREYVEELEQVYKKNIRLQIQRIFDLASGLFRNKSKLGEFDTNERIKGLINLQDTCFAAIENEEAEIVEIRVGGIIANILKILGPETSAESQELQAINDIFDRLDNILFRSNKNIEDFLKS